MLHVARMVLIVFAAIVLALLLFERARFFVPFGAAQAVSSFEPVQVRARAVSPICGGRDSLSPHADTG